MFVLKLLGKRTAEVPKDAITPSHQLLIRGGYIRQMGKGIYTLLPLAQRVRSKIEAIVRQEMDAIDSQELQMPVVTPAELWQESGRYESVGAELVRFEDRTGHPHVLNMTNEETVVDVVRANVDSYRALPLSVYQIQTKFRDEPRSRAGLVRVREFTMKDAYSFHRTDSDLVAYYWRCHRAYVRIFKRCGLNLVVDTESDTGMMGGSVAHEFMLVSPHGEDTLLLCNACGYRANREVAKAARVYPSEAAQTLQTVATPGHKTIAQVATFLETTEDRCCKAVLFVADKQPVIVFVRGDLEVNQAKLRKAVRSKDIRAMTEEEAVGFKIVAGYVGPLGLPAGIKVFFDETVARTPNLVIGANQVDHHTRGFNLARELPETVTYDLSEVKEGEPCPSCNAPLAVGRGIEVGNIFQLGTKYSAAMNLTYSEEDGTPKHAIMGCYGIGIGRTLACVIEEHHDDRGPLWPMSVAPYQVQVCCLQTKKEGVVAAGKELYQALNATGIEALFDDREVSAGFMFADADLIGAPVRAIVSPRNLAQGIVELKYRHPGSTEGLPTQVPLATAVTEIRAIVDTLNARYGVTMEPARL